MLAWALWLGGAWIGRGGDGGQGLPRANPARAGVSPAALLRFVEQLDSVDQVHSVMVVRRGRVILEGWWAPYDAATPHELYSLSKTFTSTAVGLAVGEGRLAVDDPVLKFFPGEAPGSPGENLRAMRVKDLLTMSTGHQEEAPLSPAGLSARAFLAQPVPHRPGTHFKYNTPATFLQSALVQSVTGETVRDYLQSRLFDPLGMGRPRWDTNFQGITLGGYGLRLRTEDLAKFGQLYLQQGRWRGRQLVPAEWVAAASAKQVSNGSNPASDWDQGYGYQIWRCRPGGYRGDGAFGQYCVVLPEQEAVVALTAAVRDMQGVLNGVWDHLLPALSARTRGPARPAEQRALERRLQGLEVRRPQGRAGVPQAPPGVGRTYELAPNALQWEAFELSPLAGGGWNWRRQIAGVWEDLPCGVDRWREGHGRPGVQPRGPVGPLGSEPLSAAAAWTGDDTLAIKVCVRETPYQVTFALQFTGDEVAVTAETNVGFGQTRPATLRGRAARPPGAGR
ncbi:MAG: serine hydrolase domain-containing protein [Verrucomicrobiota bacterium]